MRKSSQSRPSQIATAIGSLALWGGCVTPDVPLAITDGGSPVSISPRSIGTADPSRSVCTPLGTAGGSVTPQHGLWGQLYYLEPGMTRYTQAVDYQTHGTHANVELFFNQVAVPTRPFDQGFTTLSGVTLATAQGSLLFEWFGVKLQSQVQLGPNDRAGKYQFALLSDDGAVLSLDASGTGFQTWINNDGVTPSRLACAGQTIRMDGSSRVPLQIDYFQGPRYHVALTLLWREIPACSDEVKDPTVLHDPVCGLAGNSTFFDSSKTPSVPTQLWLSMLGRGWKVLSPENFILPDQAPLSPCPPPTPGVGA